MQQHSVALDQGGGLKPENSSDVRSNQEMGEGSTETQRAVMKPPGYFASHYTGELCCITLQPSGVRFTHMSEIVFKHGEIQWWQSR